MQLSQDAAPRRGARLGHTDTPRLLGDLDGQQQSACEHLRGPVRILAGAGTGKTRTLTHRIAVGVAEGVYDPESVLALTFTKKAAAEMRVRLQRLGVTGVQARTFHSAAFAQLRHFWPRAVGPRQPQLITAKLPLITEAAQRSNIDLSTPDAARTVAAEIEWRKVRDLSLDQYARAGRGDATGLSQGALLEVMQKYERVKDEQRGMDFEDVLLVTLGMLRTVPAALAAVQMQYRVFLVDEFQDVSPVQFELLQTWMGDRRDVCVVGDPNQTIFSFTGADPALLLDFPKYFPGTKTCSLTRNYRSTEPIVQLANRVVAGDPGALALTADRPGPVPQAVRFDDADAEAEAVAHAIVQALADGEEPSRIAVLFRINAQSFALERALSAAGVPVSLRKAVPFFARPAVAKATVTLGVAAAQQNDQSMLGVLEEVLRSCGWHREPPTEGGEAMSVWSDLQALLDCAHQLPPDATVTTLYRELLERKNNALPPAERAVVLSTIHAAKGLEWDRVFVIGICEGSLPISSASTPAEIDEERRLFYVAITRAQRWLHLSWPARVGRSPRDHSRFLDRLRVKRAR